MALKRTGIEDVLATLGLERSKTPRRRISPRDLRRVLRLLPTRHRCLIRLLYYRGASQTELAGALGISRPALRRMLRQAVSRATDPRTIAILGCWRRLTPYERRLAYLHRILGVSLARIAALGLVAIPAGRSESEWARARYLRHTMRTIQRRADRHARRVGVQAPPSPSSAG
jgi:hypothetical protein